MIDSAKTHVAELHGHITTPIAGRTGIRVNVDVGNVIHATDTTGLVTVSQIQPIRRALHRAAAATATGSFKAAQARISFEVQALGNRTATQAVDRYRQCSTVIDNTIDADDRHGETEARNFQNPKLLLWPGIFVERPAPR